MPKKTKSSKTYSLQSSFRLICSAIIALVIISGLAYGWYIYESCRDNLHKTLEQQTLEIDKALSDMLGRASDLLSFAGSEISRNSPGNLENISELLVSVSANAKANNLFTWSGFSWAKEDAQIVVTSRDGVLPNPIDATARSYIPKAKEEPGRLHLSPPSPGLISGLPIIPAGYGVIGKHGNHLGTITMGFNIPVIAETFRKALLSEGIILTVLTRDLVPVFQVSGSSYREVVDMDKLMVGVNISSKHFGVFTSDDEKDSSFFYRSPAKSPFIIVAGYDPTLSAQDLQEVLLPKMVEFLVITTVVILLLYVLYLRAILPVLELSNISRKIKKREADYTIPEIRSDEIREISEQIRTIDELIASRDCLLDALGEEKKRNLEHNPKVSHDFLNNLVDTIKTPIEGIAFFANSIEKEPFGPLGDKQYYECIDEIKKLSSYLIAAIDNLHCLNRIDTSELELHESYVDVKSTIYWCTRLIENSNAEKRAKIKVLIPTLLPRLKADELRLKQVIINLLHNALIHTPSDGKIVVTAEFEDEHLLIRVEDNGNGIPLERLKKVMRRFNGVEDTFDSEGIGLGLPLSNELMKLHDGALELESTEGEGTVVTLCFPESRLMGTQGKHLRLAVDNG